MDYFLKISKIVLVLSFTGLFFLLWRKTPYQNVENVETLVLNWQIIIIFNTIFLFFLWSLFFLILFWWRTREMTRRGKKSQIGIVLRQSFWLAMTGIILMILQQLRALFWWDSLLVITAIMLIEMFFLSFRKDNEVKRFI